MRSDFCRKTFASVMLGGSVGAARHACRRTYGMPPRMTPARL
ncbi:hypothetical protein GBP346_B3091 [Burkholderia pseudomallei MSHR346]|nr:hypothetical protein GBP346_B3091 [Burkholderia pseudomallei MSHR346]